MPIRVKIPVPTLLSAPLPDMTPEKSVLVLSFPVVRVAVRSITLPEPASEPMLLLKPAKSRVASTVNAELLENAVANPACRVPPLTVVGPE